MRAITIIFATVLLTYCCENRPDDARYSIIPLPQEIIPANGEFVFLKGDEIVLPFDSSSVAEAAARFTERLNTVFGLEIKTIGNSGEGRIILTRNNTVANEGYVLEIEKNRIRIEASSDNGFMYALETICQLLPASVYGSERVNEHPSVPCCFINDYPRFSYRGFHLDVSRHFFSVEEIKKMIEAAATRKMNRFHWHLTDDQGWRIEIKKYPLLTEKGSIRPSTTIGTWDMYWPKRDDATPHGGYYTQEQIRDVVAFAAARGVMVVPEIEMPGHALAALSVYPRFSCHPDRKINIGTGSMISDNVFCPTEATFGFIGDVLTEVAELFPGDYIHIGGDECPKNSWKECPHCQNLIRQEGLKDEYGLQSYFIRRVGEIVRKLGRRMIGWDEILDGGLAPDATVMSWRGEAGGIEAAKMGHEVIMTPSTYCYLDYYQEDPVGAPLAIGGYVPLEKCHSYDPVPEILTEEQAKYVIGVQGNLWTEYISTPRHLEYMAYPRLSALAEVGWTNSERKNSGDFMIRLEKEFARFDAQNINACREFFQTTIRGIPDTLSGTYKVEISTLFPYSEIHYTLDGSEPTANAEKYDVPLTITGTTTVKAIAVRGADTVGRSTLKEFWISKSTGCEYTASAEGCSMDWFPVDRKILLDGKRGDKSENSGWMKFPDGVEITIDLRQETNIEKIVFGCQRAPMNNTLAISSVEIESSATGTDFSLAWTVTFAYPAYGGEKEIFRHEFMLDRRTARYVRMKFKGERKRPSSYPYKVAPEIAIDEIEIY